QLLLAQAGGAGDVHVLGDLVELLNAHVLQLDEVERGSSPLGGLRGSLFAALGAEVGFGSGKRGGGRLGGRGWQGNGRRQGGRDRPGLRRGFRLRRGVRFHGRVWVPRRAWPRRVWPQLAWPRLFWRRRP